MDEITETQYNGFTMSIRNHSLLVQVKEMGCCVGVVNY